MSGFTSTTSTIPQVTSPKRRRVIAAGLAAVIVTAGIGGALVTSGAYFTDRKVTSANTLTAATIVLGSVGDTATAGSVVNGTNVLPIADADAATKAAVATINIRNAGTAAFDWDAIMSALTISSGAPADTATIMKAQVSRDGGTTWDAVTTAAALSGASMASASSLAASAIEPIKLRLWFPVLTPNTYQGVSVSFTLTARAIQAGTSMGTSGVVFP